MIDQSNVADGNLNVIYPSTFWAVWSMPHSISNRRIPGRLKIRFVSFRFYERAH